MSIITREQAKDLRNAFQCWQQDYDPVEDKEQYDMFGLGMVAMDALLASLEPVSVIQIDHESSLIKHVKRVVSETNAPPAPVSVPDENGLFPCPFCGGRPEEDAGGCSEYDGHEHQDYAINCKSCGAEVYCAVGSFEKADIPCSCHHSAREVCVEKWNRRATMLQGAEPVTTAYKLPAKTPCKDAPEHIWLQTAGIWPENGEFSELTWCSENQHPDDTLYVRADVVPGNSPVVPDGWVMVPVEPTEDMIVNGFESEPDESFSDAEVWEAYDAMSGCQQAAHRAKLCWSAMISAAPKPDVR
ncbi:Lar family restriction alleviation protein [Enterobacter cloacae]|uniref:Lar family restriction alleviation protein n=1 Tax=Enterobacter cloacae TaxID=550 RepID=UPI002A838C73|nr:hypothetical protein [Enterobacter cloacae]